MQISLEPIRKMTSSFKQKSLESLAIIAEIDEQVKSLQSTWEEITEQKFYHEYLDWRTNMTQLSYLLESIGSQVEGIVEKFESVDVC